jgi:UV DNA damage endonuclease
MLRLGYACINDTLQNAAKITPNKGMIKRTFISRGSKYAANIALQNIRSMQKILAWNSANNISIYRMSSSLFPWMSEYKISELFNYKEIKSALEDCGEYARSTGQRLSFHPGQFCVLASQNENVIANSVRELEKHGEIMDIMNMPKSHGAKINIHIGGAYGDRGSAIDRFCKNFENHLSHSVKSRLTIENDDKESMFSTKMLHDGAYSRIGTPIVFDSHHWEIGPKDQDYRDAFYMAKSTWPNNVIQQCHHSNSKRKYEDSTASKQSHSSWYYTPFENFGEQVDVVLECKKKEKALIKYKEDFI